MSDSVTLWTVAQQAPLLMELSRQEYWSGLPGSPPGDLPNPGIEPTPPRSPVLAAAFFTSSASWKALSVSHSLQPTLCNPMDCYPPGFSVHGILQARIWEWVAIPFSRRSSQPRDRTQVSRIAGRFLPSEAPGNLLLLSWSTGGKG